MNVYAFALKMELDGKDYYEKLAADSTLPGLTAIFALLAADEQKHHDTIQEMQRRAGGQMADTTVVEQAQNVFQELQGKLGSDGGLKKAAEGYLHALKIEADSVRLYEEMAKQEEDQGNVILLLKIANEEKKHYNVMGNLYDLVLKPEYFLAWREFSNLQEF